MWITGIARSRRRGLGYSMIGVTGPLSLVTAIGFSVLHPLHGFMQDSRRCAVVNDLLISLRLAQQSASLLGHTVTVCAAADARAIRCADRGDWSHGWIAFVDADGDGTMSAAESRQVLLRTVNSNAGVRVSSTQKSFSFPPFSLRGAGPEAAAGALNVCDERGVKAARAVVVSPSAPPHAADADRSAAMVCPS